MIWENKLEVRTDLSDYIIRKGETAEFKFSGEKLDLDSHHRLYFTCEDRMHHGLKDEPQTDKLYMLIDDSLNTENAKNRRYCLDMSEKFYRPFPKRAVIQLMWPSFVDVVAYGATNEWKFGISAKTENLKINENGYLRLRFERWEKKENVHPKLTVNAPDDTYIINIPEGTYDYKDLRQTVTIPDSTACVVLTVEGENYSGKVYLEEPSLISSVGNNACPDFDLCIPNLERFTWVGQNLSKKEWPEFLIKLNGETVYEGEVFLRVHRYAPVEITIPDEIKLKDNNKLTITYISDYHDTVPLSIREIKILERPKKDFVITYCPETAVWGDSLKVLIRTEKENVKLECVNKDFLPIKALNFENAGLHVATFEIIKKENRQTLSLTDGNITDSAEIVKVIEKQPDNIKCGSSDMIYIDATDLTAVEDFIEWFETNELGNLITVRPAYRWGGARFINEKAWEKFCEICDGLGIYYAHMLDGRDLPGIPCNPSYEMLDGKNFLGRQEHERDGQLFYWGYPSRPVKTISDAWFTLTGRLEREIPETSFHNWGGENVEVAEDLIVLQKEVCKNADMKDAYECSVRSLAKTKHDSTRHTGPTVMFKYFYEAGFDWAGSETMYSSMEPLLAFARGAAKAYGKKDLGVHHAVQWSTYPHDTPERYRRFLLALYTSYINDVTEINTEEGFWHIESKHAYFNRFSDCCKKHSDAEKRMVKYMNSHTRSGKYYTPVSFLHGRYDGFDGFNRTKVFGMPHMNQGDAEHSWTLMRVFYPLTMQNDSNLRFVAISPLEDNKPRGFYSGTPMGNIDVMPVEKGDYSDYKLLSFAGYNCAIKEDFDRLGCYVEKGGMLLGGWPHFSDTTALDEIQNYEHKYLNHKLISALTDGTPVFEEQTYKGNKISVCINLVQGGEILEKTEEGTPVVYGVDYGKGKIILVNCKFYPGNKAIYSAYENTLKKYTNEFLAEESSQVICGNDIEYSMYVQPDGAKHYYITPVDWYNDESFNRKAQLRLKNDLCTIEIPFGVIVKVVSKDDIMCWCEEESAEIIALENNSVTVQGEDIIHVHIFKDGKETVEMADCSKNSGVKINL